VLFAPAAAAESAAEDVLRRVGRRPGHVFNLGHGLLPATPLANIERLVDVVHERSAALRAEAVAA
jgi:uroporphyrinogen decarboxylase